MTTRVVAVPEPQQSTINFKADFLEEDMDAVGVKEIARLAAVRRYEVLDTPPDGSFDRLTRLAAGIFNVPIALISIVDEDRIWFMSKHGLDVSEIPRSPGLCASAILGDGPWLLSDAARDPRSMSNPLVAGEFGLKFYLGCPLMTSEGANLGTICVIDKQPRSVTPKEVEALQDLASIVMGEMEVRLNARRAVRQRDNLLREVHHRVGNNLQIVASLLAVQQRTVKGTAKRLFGETQRRVQLMGLLHKKFYSGADVEFIQLKDHLQQLGRVIIDSFGLASRVQLRLTGDDLSIDLNVATPLTLLVSEIIANSCQHAFPKNRNGCIYIEISAQEAELWMVVGDDGIGSRTAPGKGMGTRLIDSFATQLGSDINLRTSSAGGTSYSLRIPSGWKQVSGSDQP